MCVVQTDTHWGLGFIVCFNYCIISWLTAYLNFLQRIKSFILLLLSFSGSWWLLTIDLLETFSLKTSYKILHDATDSRRNTYCSENWSWLVGINYSNRREVQVALLKQNKKGVYFISTAPNLKQKNSILCNYCFIRVVIEMVCSDYLGQASVTNYNQTHKSVLFRSLLQQKKLQ